VLDYSKLSFAPITYGGKPISVHKAIMNPEFNKKTVLVGDTWDYVEMWLKRNHKKEALHYWNQARCFSKASLQLDKTSSPLTIYYSILNASKSLLSAKGINFDEHHGVSGESLGDRCYLYNEFVCFREKGVLSELCKYLGESANKETCTLHQLLYSLPYVHRAFNLTFRSWPELFTPISYPMFVRRKRSNESWFCAVISEKRYANMRTLAKFPDKFEKDNSVKECFMIRFKDTFIWENRGSHHTENIERLTTYHRQIRKHLYYIYGPMYLWYVKRNHNIPAIMDRSSLTITFAAMHKLSELARYKPSRLLKHYESPHNWLISEFISTALCQFLDEISAEMTGQEFMMPQRRISE
jgi:uncharacterized protein (UPF0332 family)